MSYEGISQKQTEKKKNRNFHKRRIESDSIAYTDDGHHDDNVAHNHEDSEYQHSKKTLHYHINLC